MLQVRVLPPQLSIDEAHTLERGVRFVILSSPVTEPREGRVRRVGAPLFVASPRQSLPEAAHEKDRTHRVTAHQYRGLRARRELFRQLHARALEHAGSAAR